MKGNIPGSGWECSDTPTFYIVVSGHFVSCASKSVVSQFYGWTLSLVFNAKIINAEASYKVFGPV